MRRALRLALAVFYAIAGVLHLKSGPAFVAIVPDWVPWPGAVVAATGVCEMAGAAGLLIPAMRKPAGVLLALYAVCVFPANLHHAFDHVRVPGLPDSWWYHAPRLAFQPVLVWAALFAGGVIDWPWRRPPRLGVGHAAEDEEGPRPDQGEPEQDARSQLLAQEQH